MTIIDNTWNNAIEYIDYSKEVLIWYNDTLQVLHECNDYHCFRLILIEEGTGIANMGGKRISFTAPAVFCLDETEKLVLEKSANIAVKYIFFFPMAMNSNLNYQNLRDENSNLSLTERNDRTYLRPFFLRTEGYYGFMDIGVNMAKRLSQLFERINKEISEKKDDYWPCNSRSYFLELLLCVERHYSKHLETNYVLLNENASDMDDILLYLHLNYSKKITLTGLTRQFNINRTSLNEQFSKAMNMSVMAYLIKFRIKLASMLLRDTMIPVSEVAERVGFGDTANFNRSFKNVTHTHGDHFSVSDLKKVMKKDAMLVITDDGAAQARKDGMSSVVSVAPNKEYEVKGIKFSTVPAYNVNKDFHPKESKWVGYIININNVKYYHAGDTDLIPEMKNIKADVAFLPVGGTYTMTAEEAVKAAGLIKPKIAVPIHFADVVGSADDAQAFVNGLDKDIQGVVLKDLLKGVQHFKQSTIRIQGNKVIYFDPFMVDGEPKDADYVFITHTHGDHFSGNDLKKVIKSNTVVIITQDGVADAVKLGLTNIVTAAPEKSYEIDGLRFKTTRAYNVDKEFHKKESNWVGYIVNVNNINYYHAGDTDTIPEMKDIKANVAFLPIGGTYTMTAEEAAKAANTIKPLVAVPIHFVDVVGTWDDADRFCSLLDKGIKGEILKQK